MPSEYSKQEIRELYDREAGAKKSDLAGFDTMNVSSLNKFPLATRYFYERKLSEMVRIGNIKKGDNILEIGCKDGLITFILAKMGYKITAIDLSPKCIELAKEIAKMKGIDNVSFFTADVEDLSQFPENFFDAAVSFSVLRYVPHPQKALKEIHRILKKKGVLVADFPNRLCPWFKLIKPLSGIKQHIHDHLYFPGQIKNMFEENGFCNIKIRLILYTHKEIPPHIFLVLKIIGEILERIPFINKTAAIIMCRGIKR